MKLLFAKIKLFAHSRPFIFRPADFRLALTLGENVHAQEPQKKKEKTEKKNDSKAKQDMEKGWDKTKEGTKKGAKETKEFFKEKDKKDPQTANRHSATSSPFDQYESAREYTFTAF